MAINQKNISCLTCKKRSSCFNELSKADHRILEANRLELKFKRGEVICKQGAFASNIMFIYKGIAKSYLETENGKHVILNVLPEGQMIGLPALFSNNVFPYSAAAVEDCIVCSIDINIFEEYTKSNGGFASEIIKTMNTCTINNYDRYISITQKQMNGRLADVFLHLADYIYKSNQFIMSLSRNDLAEMTHMSPESVTRIITRFKNDKLIKVTGKSYEIRNTEELRKISYLG